MTRIRTPGRPTSAPPTAPPALVAAETLGRSLLCPRCGKATLRVTGPARKSDRATPLRCESCGEHYLRLVALAPA